LIAQASLLLSIAATAFLLASVIGVAHRKPGYRHTSDTISELAEYGSGYSWPVSLGVFLPVAAALSVVAWLLQHEFPQAAALSVSIAAGYGLSAMFPCDPGSPLIGSLRQTIHNLGGGIEYIGGAFSLLWISELAGPGFRIAGMLVGVSAILLSFEIPARGLVQRIAESCLFGGLIAALWMRW